ncbi:hypothetical protein [Microbacterium sp.]|uniref:hypothetical protein n=1 Tax=Microbacterium sp. TaxID=51671 RepID=UPI003F6F6898
MGNALDASGKPIFSSTPPQTVVDLQAGVDYTKKYAFRRAGTASARSGLAPGEIWDGLEFYETDTELTFEYDGSGWNRRSPALLAIETANTQTLTSGAYADVVFTGQTPATIGVGLSIVPATGIVTCSLAGLYRIFGAVTFALGGSASTHALAVSINGSTTYSRQASSNASAVAETVDVEAFLQLNANDTVKLRAIQNSGANKVIGAANGYSTQLMVQRLA